MLYAPRPHPQTSLASLSLALAALPLPNELVLDFQSSTQMALLDLAPSLLPENPQHPLPSQLCLQPAERALTGPRASWPSAHSALFTGLILLACPPPAPITLSTPQTSPRSFSLHRAQPRGTASVSHADVRPPQPRTCALWRPGEGKCSVRESYLCLFSHQTELPGGQGTRQCSRLAGHLLPARELYCRCHKKAGSGTQPGMRQVTAGTGSPSGDQTLTPQRFYVKHKGTFRRGSES